MKVQIVISVVSTFCWDLHHAILVISCIILLFCATNFKRAINRDKIFNRIVAPFFVIADKRTTIPGKPSGDTDALPGAKTSSSKHRIKAF